MSLTPGSRVGSYTILSSLGAGGMGEVYRARDNRLNREVALKVLPASVAGDPDRLSRFEREAQVLAALNHPNIAHIHGFEESDGGNAIVMELVEGPTLADRLASGPLPLEEALPVARQIAETLEAAHEQGIVHRDLKPANIKVRDDGTVKVLDFGLAKALDADAPRAGSGEASVTPTMTSPAVTRLGSVLGTAAYMSPEQAKGKTVDRRADIWAFGCVVVEMLTGRPLFGGDTVSETIASVIRDAPDFDRLPADTPRRVRRLLERCLDRDPRTRLRDIGEARIVLARPDEPEAARPASPAASPSRSRVLPMAIAGGAIVLAAAAAAIAWRTKPQVTIPLRRFDMPAVMTASTSGAIAPDGSRIAYLTGGRLFVHDLATGTASDLGALPAGTGDLFWSPDGQSIGFTTEASLRTIPAAGGPVFVVCHLPETGQILGAAWRTDGTILFSSWRGSLYSVSASGGTPQVALATDPKTDVDFHSISPLPDGRFLVGRHSRSRERNEVDLVDGTKVVRLINDPNVTHAQFVPPDLVIFLREGANAGIWAAHMGTPPIDVGTAVRIAGGGDFAAAPDGTLLAYSLILPEASFVWLDRHGRITQAAGPPLALARNAIDLAGDARHVLAATRSVTGGGVVMRDLQAGTDTPLTFDRGADAQDDVQYVSASWFPDGKHVVYGAGPVEGMKLYVVDVTRPTARIELEPGFRARVTPDMQHLYWTTDDRGRFTLHRATIGSDGRPGKESPVFTGPDVPDVSWFDLSSDGQWLVYDARQPDGATNLWMAGVADTSARRQLTTDGTSRYARFSPDGSELFYVERSTGPSGEGGIPERSGTLMAVPLGNGPSPSPGVPRPLFDVDRAGRPSTYSGWAVAADGRFLMSQLTAEAAPRLTLVQNWPALLKR